MLNSSIAVLAVADVLTAVAFYRDVLGFKENWLWDDPPNFGSIGLGKAEIFLCCQPDLAGRVEGLMHCFNADDITGLYELHRSKRAPIVSPLENKPWGMREYTVRDLNGYHLRFGSPAVYERPRSATDSLPAHIDVTVGLPTVERYIELLHSVRWAVHQESTEAALKHSFGGVLATDTRDGQVVGMARAIGDGKYFTIVDVIVRPSHQGQKIGSALMQAIMTELRRRALPGAFVGLFTGKPEFYERLGFSRGIGMYIGL